MLHESLSPRYSLPFLEDTLVSGIWFAWPSYWYLFILSLKVTFNSELMVIKRKMCGLEDRCLRYKVDNDEGTMDIDHFPQKGLVFLKAPEVELSSLSRQYRHQY